jgi:hypothetical protein
MRLKLKILLLLLLLSVGLIGCARQLILYPITQQDIAVVTKNEPAPFDGFLMSKFYMNEVLQAKLESK